MEREQELLIAAREYATNKSSSSIFIEAHTADFIAGAQWEAERSKWVSVEDRLPEMEEIFLAWDDKNKKCLFEKRSESMFVSNDWTYKESYKTHITHWQPLPTPPSKD